MPRYRRGMTDLLAALSSQLSTAADTAAASVVQLQGHRRLVAGVVVDSDLVMTPGLGVVDGTVAVRRADGTTLEGTLLGRSAATGLAVVRVPGLGAPAATVTDEPKPGHLALAIGRTWSGGLFTALAPIAVVGGPLRTGRTSEIARVIRLGLAPHDAFTGGALADGMGRVSGVITSMAIRGTTVVIPASLAVQAARDLTARGSTRRAYLGVSSVPVTLAARQQQDGYEAGLLVTGLVADGPADAAGLLVGDVIVGFDGARVSGSDELLARVSVASLDRATPVSVCRGDRLETIAVTLTERPRG